jgi:uncharacterized protein (TIGR02646 family)
MIPVSAQPEPSNFHADVREKGHLWLRDRGIALDAAPPRGTKLEPYWTRTNKELWEAYSRTCAYLAIYFEFTTGASSTDHFIAKSADAGQAYEWSNYRLSCLGPNRHKNNFSDLLDPIGLAPETFQLEFANGKIKPNPSLTAEQQRRARKTIERLRLDSPNMREMRVRHFDDYTQGQVTAACLKRLSPFVWYEATRQGLL